MPQPAGLESYDRAVSAVGNFLRNRGGLVSLYQLGSVTAPGISDIDLLAVFKDGSKCAADPLRELAPPYRRLFIHGVFGLSKGHYRRFLPFALLVQRRLLWGEEIGGEEEAAEGGGAKELRAQVALEYLARTYIALAVERSYGVVKVRNFLLHSRAMLLDLELLDHSSGSLYEQLLDAMRLRDGWFAEDPDRGKLPDLADTLFCELSLFLGSTLQARALSVPADSNLEVAPNMRIEPGKELSFRRTGIVLPRVLRKLGPKYVNLQNRFNRFVFQVPVESLAIHETVLRRHRLLKEIHEYNRLHLPAFSPFSYGLPLFAGAA
jgi:hypothetical protein